MSIDAILAIPEHLIDRVSFFRREDVRTDPYCCEVLSRGITFFAYQEDEAWPLLMQRLGDLPGFMADWYTSLSEPPFERVNLVAFERPGRSLGG